MNQLERPWLTRASLLCWFRRYCFTAIWGMAMTTEDADKLEVEVREKLGDPESWPHPVGFPDSLALCALNSVYSLRGTSAAGRNVMRRYRAHRQEQGANPDYDDGSDLLEAIDHVGGPERFASEVLRNRTKLSSTGRYKAEGLYEGVHALVQCGVNTAEDLRKATHEGRETLSREWLKTRGLGPASWDYLVMNAEIEDIKVDTMIRRFFERAIGNPSPRPESR